MFSPPSGVRLTGAPLTIFIVMENRVIGEKKMANGGAIAQEINRKRWAQLIFCIICMIMIANLQYGWTLFVNPINKAHGWSIASIQVAFADLHRA